MHKNFPIWPSVHKCAIWVELAGQIVSTLFLLANRCLESRLSDAGLQMTAWRPGH